MTDEKNFYERWYSSIPVMFELIKQFKDKEVIFFGYDYGMPRIRWLKIHNIDTLKKQYQEFRFFKRRFFNVYHSLSYYNNLPIMSYDFKKRKEQQKELNLNINQHPEKWIRGLDLGLDFDAKDLTEAIGDVLLIKHDLDKFQIKYMIKFSGKKGFHIVLPFEIMPTLEDCEYLISFYKEIIEALYEKYKALSTLDISIYDLKRIFKTAYSIDVRTNKICMPLTDYELNHFCADDYDINKAFYKYITQVKSRGLLWRNDDVNLEIKKKRFLYWIEHISKKS